MSKKPKRPNPFDYPSAKALEGPSILKEPYPKPVELTDKQRVEYLQARITRLEAQNDAYQRVIETLAEKLRQRS